MYIYTSWVTRRCSGKVSLPRHSICEIPFPIAPLPSFLSTLLSSLATPSKCVEIPRPHCPLLPVHPSHQPPYPPNKMDRHFCLYIYIDVCMSNSGTMPTLEIRNDRHFSQLIQISWCNLFLFSCINSSDSSFSLVKTAKLTFALTCLYKLFVFVSKIKNVDVTSSVPY